jgi:hypothetical protein
MIFLAIVLGIGAIARSAQEESAVGIANGPRRLWLILAALILLHGSVAFVIAKNWLPVIDTYTFQWDASNNLAHGIDPYGATQADLYGPGSKYYAPGMVVNGRVQVGFPYPPLSLLWVLPGYFLGDVRYAYILAVMISALLLFRMCPNARSLGTAALLLLNPFTFFCGDEVLDRTPGPDDPVRDPLCGGEETLVASGCSRPLSGFQTIQSCGAAVYWRSGLSVSMEVIREIGCGGIARRNGHGAAVCDLEFPGFVA